MSACQVSFQCYLILTAEMTFSICTETSELNALSCGITFPRHPAHSVAVSKALSVAVTIAFVENEGMSAKAEDMVSIYSDHHFVGCTSRPFDALNLGAAAH